MKPLIHDFSSTTLTKAFILNAISLALITGVTTALTIAIDDAYKNKNKKLSVWAKLGIAMGIASVSAAVVYVLLYFIFGFGRGMLASPVCPKLPCSSVSYPSTPSPSTHLAQPSHLSTNSSTSSTG